MRRRHFSPFKSFLPLATRGEKRDSTAIYIIHGTNGRKQTIEWFKKRESLDETVTGGRREMYASLCALGPIFPGPSHSSPLPTHTQSHCPMFVINLWSPYASLPIKTRLHGKEIIFFSLRFLLMGTF